MSGVTQAVFMNQRSFASGPGIGDAYEGGFFAGQISVAGNGVASHNLVIAPKATGQSANLQWKTVNTAGDPTSLIDGPANSAYMNSGTYPMAQFCENLSIGGYTDWYMPAYNELEVCYYNLKPTTTSNNASSGINTNAVPSRGSNYTAGDPAQTVATDFQDTNTEAFVYAGSFRFYFSSTQWDASAPTQLAVRYVYFADGAATYQGIPKTGSASYYFVRAVRRVAV